MKKILIGGAAMLALTGTWMATAGTNINQAQPQAQAYIRLPFGGDAHAPREPFHYGLRLDYDSRTRALAGRDVPALANFDFDNRGNRLAFVGGVPFAGRIVNPPLRANEGDTASGGSGSGGFTFFDWGLLAAGAGGLGYAIYKVTENKNSPEPSTSGGGTTAGGTTAGGTTGLGNIVGTAVSGVLSFVSSALNGAVPTAFSGGSREVPGVLPLDPTDGKGATSYQQWLDGGTGHMGDLNPH